MLLKFPYNKIEILWAQDVYFYELYHIKNILQKQNLFMDTYCYAYKQKQNKSKKNNNIFPTNHVLISCPKQWSQEVEPDSE